MSNYFDEASLLIAPTERAAFSDRQAWVCAEMSRLAYFRFEGGHAIDQVLAIAKEVIGDNEKYVELADKLELLLASSRETTAANSLEAFKAILDAAGFDYVDTYNEGGTQAFLCKRKVSRDTGGDKTVVYLAFRGTEPKDFRDIRTDIRARLKEVPVDGEEEKISLHSGYYDSLHLVADGISKKLSETAHDQLIVCGHSLGGALGIVYTRLYASGVNGACYTFGAPPVGDANVQKRLKTPVYEIVNELDVVPRLPSPWLVTATALLFHLVRLGAKLIKVVDGVILTGKRAEKIEEFIDMLMRYRHPGYMSYLKGSGKDATLRYNLGSYDKTMLWFRMVRKKGLSRFAKLVKDHAIGEYVSKLKTHALNRNPGGAAAAPDQATDTAPGES